MDKEKNDFLTKEKVLEIFKDFKIEYFEEVHQKNNNGTVDHIFNVIAQKLKVLK